MISRYSPGEWLRIVLQLGKIRISQLVALSTATGFILATGTISVRMILPTVGIFILACGSAALNQVQERNKDALMNRTRNRPIPSGRISAREGLVISLALFVVGAVVLYWGSNLTALLLGLFNGFWYNGVYTPLKKRSALAVIPGALIGAVPPAVGWVAGGGHLFDIRLLALAFFFFIWQIPHFWLLLLNFGKDYDGAGFPSLTRKFDNAQLARITFMWILATVAACLFIPLYGVGHSSYLMIGLLLAAIWLMRKSLKLLSSSVNPKLFLFAFKDINIYILFVMTIFSLDRLLTAGM